MIVGGNTRYELAEKAGGTSYGGLSAIHAFVQKIGLPKCIDEALHLFKKHLPYHESDHVLNFAYNAMCGGTCLQDIELRRNASSLRIGTEDRWYELRRLGCHSCIRTEDRTAKMYR